MHLPMLIALALCALMARPAQALDGEFDLDGIPIVSGELIIMIEEGHDELVECLRWAANQGKVEIGGCAQITGLIIPGLKVTTYVEEWDRLAATTGLTSIRPRFLSSFGPSGRWYFVLIFSPFPDRLTAYRLYYLYASQLYLEYVHFVELLATGSAIAETTWGFIKHRQLDLSRKAFHAKD